jgi:hypothetical protein
MEVFMRNPFPSPVPVAYENDGFEENRAWLSPSLRRHLEVTNALGYVPAVVGLASLVVPSEVKSDLKKTFDLFFHK